jgi:hypothetical protein
MKKSFIFILSFIVTALVSCGDMDDCKVDNTIATSVLITNSGIQNVTLSQIANGSYTVYLYKGGYNGDCVKVGLAAADSLVTQYNASKGTSYQVIPSQYYTIGNAVELNNKHYNDSIQITFSNLSSLDFNTNGDKYVLPLTISGISSDLINQDNKNILIHISGN